MHLTLQEWHLLVIWIVGLAWAFGLTGDIWRCCRLLWLKRQALRSLNRTLFQMQMEHLRQQATLKAVTYACEHVLHDVPFTVAQVQALAQGLAEEHVFSAHYTHVSEKQAERCYIATFSTAYFLHTGEASIVVLPFGQKKTAILF